MKKFRLIFILLIVLLFPSCMIEFGNSNHDINIPSWLKGNWTVLNYYYNNQLRESEINTITVNDSDIILNYISGSYYNILSDYNYNGISNIDENGRYTIVQNTGISLDYIVFEHDDEIVRYYPDYSSSRNTYYVLNKN